jgi:hypothetical protein
MVTPPIGEGPSEEDDPSVALCEPPRVRITFFSSHGSGIPRALDRQRQLECEEHPFSPAP